MAKRRRNIPAELYVPADAVKGTGAIPSQLEHWSRTALIEPEVPSGGTGRHRAFSLVNLIEIAVAVRLNRFRMPIAVIRDAVYGFRWFHELSVAIFKHGTDAQFEAYLAHEKLLKNSTTTPPHPGMILNTPQRLAIQQLWVNHASSGVKTRTASVATPLFKLLNEKLTDVEQAIMIRQAYSWRFFCHGRESRRHTFFGLFAFPESGGTTIQDEPIDLKVLIEESAVVISLGPLLTSIENRLQRFDLMDQLFQTQEQ